MTLTVDNRCPTILFIGFGLKTDIPAKPDQVFGDHVEDFFSKFWEKINFFNHKTFCSEIKLLNVGQLLKLKC